MPFDWERVFGRVAPRILDVGCGLGHFVIEAAAADPGRDYLGIESVGPLVEQASREAVRRGLANARFVAADAAAWLSSDAAPGSLDEIHVYHPQPYYDPGQVPLELLSRDFFERAWTVLRPGGLLVLQTDNRRYGKHLLEAVANGFEPSIQEGPWPDAPLGRTAREIMARRKGLPILRILARRRERPLERPAPAPYFNPARPGLRRRRLNRKKAASQRGPGGHAIIE
jgi:tRNA (guanine-N7-)-methyltransferase